MWFKKEMKRNLIPSNKVWGQNIIQIKKKVEDIIKWKIKKENCEIILLHK